MSELKIKGAAEAACDFMSLGALVTRLDPGLVPLRVVPERRHRLAHRRHLAEVHHQVEALDGR